MVWHHMWMARLATDIAAAAAAVATAVVVIQESEWKMHGNLFSYQQDI